MCGILGRSRKGDGVMLSCYKNLLYGAIPISYGMGCKKRMKE